MDNCNDLFILSTIACKISDCLSDDELSILAINLTALGDMLQAVLTKRIVRNSACQSNTSHTI